MFRRAIAHLRCRISRKHDHLAHPRHLRQLRLDLSQLDPETAYLHLEVVSTQIFQPPVRAPTRQISRPIQPPARHERIVDEPLPRQLRPVQVPACDTRPAHIQLSRHAHRHRLATIIQHVQLQIRNPHADRTRTQTHGVFRSQRTIRHVHRRLGDSIHVHQLRTLAVTGIPRRERPRLQRLSTEDDIAQPVGDYVCALDIPGRFLPLLLRRHQRLERARRLIQHRHAFRAQQRKERRRRARYLRRQLQQRRRAGQVRLPERALLLQLAARQPPALPCGVVRVLQRQRRQRIALLRDERPVQRAQLLQEHPDRPAVRCDVVHHHLYDVGFIRQLQQQYSHRQVSAQVEWRRCVGLAQVLCPLFGLLRFTQVVVAHRQIGMRLDHLDRFTLLPNEARPQCFVAHHDTVQRTLQHLSIQRPIKPHRAAHVVRLADAFQLRQEP
ncbi:Uncharacterised protein [Burkholderia pseudomallei]|nr:Uncharacterised protein [Burkholderia pseudomallei]